MTMNKNLRLAAVALCSSALAVTPALAADAHLVPLTELHRQAVEKTRNREQNLKSIKRALSLAPAQKALQAAGIDARSVTGKAMLLNDSELASLAARADKVANDFTAGALSNEHLTYIVIALATAVLIIVLVAA